MQQCMDQLSDPSNVVGSHGWEDIEDIANDFNSRQEAVEELGEVGGKMYDLSDSYADAAATNHDEQEDVKPIRTSKGKLGIVLSVLCDHYNGQIVC